MDVGHEHDGLFGIIDMYGEGLAFFKGGDAYPYASGFSDAAEAMGFRIAWNREQDKSLQIESVICEKHGVGMTKDGDLILSAFRARLVDVGGRFGKGHSNIYGLDDCRIHGGLLPIVEFYDMDVNRDRYLPVRWWPTITRIHSSGLTQAKASLTWAENAHALGTTRSSVVWSSG